MSVSIAHEDLLAPEGAKNYTSRNHEIHLSIYDNTTTSRTKDYITHAGHDLLVGLDEEPVVMKDEAELLVRTFFKASTCRPSPWTTWRRLC